MNGGTIANCTSANKGGAVFIDAEGNKGGTFSMNGGTIKNCSAKLGGAVYVSGGTDLFENFKNCVPGDVRTQEIAVSNTTNGMVRIYMKAEPVHPSDRDFLNQLHMTVHCEDQSIFDAAPSRRAQLTESMCCWARSRAKVKPRWTWS